MTMDGQGAAFGSVLADVLTGHVRRTEIVYHVKSVFMNKEDTVLILINLLIFITFLLIINNLSLGTKQIVLYQVRKKNGVFFWFFESMLYFLGYFPHGFAMGSFS